jgi:hypothetical protein
VPEQVDSRFVERIAAALADEVSAIVGSPVDATDDHRTLAHRVKALVAADRDDVVAHATRLATRLRGLVGPSGLFAGGDNVDSPPDSAFSINDVADTVALLRGRSDGTDPARTQLTEVLEEILVGATAPLLRGGVHTPNHRWELSAALARLHRLSPSQALLDRIEEWLAEGVDVDADGLYSERSAIYAAAVSNPSLIAIADVLERPDLLDVVERNLEATLDLLLPDGTVETVLSRRQDQRSTFPLAPYLVPLRQLAVRRARGDLAWAADLALAQGVTDPAGAATVMVLDPSMAAVLPAATPPPSRRQRHFRGAGLLVDHHERWSAVVFGGSDYARHRRIRSGLANSPTLLRVVSGSVVLDSVRLSRTFFGVGPFRSDRMRVSAEGSRTEVTLQETVATGYYQPLRTDAHDQGGSYALTDEGRFSAAMAFGSRELDRVELASTVQVRLDETGVDLVIGVDGPEVDWALELAFRPGGDVSGARAVAPDRWLLDVTPGALASYRSGSEAISVEVVGATGAGDEPPTAPVLPPAYEPGEEYGYLGGTDAATGDRLYLAGRVPMRLHLRLSITASLP